MFRNSKRGKSLPWKSRTPTTKVVADDLRAVLKDIARTQTHSGFGMDNSR